MLWDPVNKKLIRSRDVVFLEDQLFKDFDECEKLKSFVDIPIRVDPIPTPILQYDHWRFVHEEHGENDNDEAPTIDDIKPIEQIEQISSLPLVEISLRRSTRQLHLSTRYPPNEYVTRKKHKNKTMRT